MICPSRIVLSFVVCSLLPMSVAQPAPQDSKELDTSQWRTFTSRAGWSIKHPRSWRVGSCNQCSDPADPDVFVTLSQPTGSWKELMMIENLNKPAEQAGRRRQS